MTDSQAVNLGTREPLTEAEAVTYFEASEELRPYVLEMIIARREGGAQALYQLVQTYEVELQRRKLREPTNWDTMRHMCDTDPSSWTAEHWAHYGEARRRMQAAGTPLPPEEIRTQYPKWGPGQWCALGAVVMWYGADSFGLVGFSEDPARKRAHSHALYAHHAGVCCPSRA